MSRNHRSPTSPRPPRFPPFQEKTRRGYQIFFPFFFSFYFRYIQEAGVRNTESRSQIQLPQLAGEGRGETGWTER